MFDVLLKGGFLVDGTGKDGFYADLAVKDGKIAKIGKNIEGEAKKTIDVSGLVVSPGFIDFHSHSDASFIEDDRCQSKLFQGVTSELAGQCGASPFPHSAEKAEGERGYYAPTFKGYVENCRSAGLKMTTNLLMLTGHGTLRSHVIGPESRDLTASELEKMQEILEKDMEYGAWGLSLGLGYAPGVSSNQHELNALGEIVAKFGGIVTSHMRNQSRNTPTALEEMFNISRHSGVQVHIAHFKAYDKENWGRAPEFAGLLHDAQAAGIKASADIYPYTAAASGITNAWPNWAIHGGRKAALLRATPGNAEYPRLLEDMRRIFATEEDGDSLYIVTTHGKMPEADGKTIGQIAKEMELPTAEAQLAVTLKTEASADCILFGMSQDDVLHFMAQDDIVIGSDGSGMPLDPALVDGKPHPRNFGTFPRYLKLCREHKLCSLETAIHRITGRCAELLNLKSRGRLEEGMVADITVFDREKVSDNATFDNPVQKNNGIAHVLIAGGLALEHGEQTALRAGEFLLKNRD